MASETAAWGMRGMAVAPHSLAAQSAVAVLRDGGNAIEAMVAAAASIAVVYPHMNSIGGDAFWLIHIPGETPRAIDACGAAGARATPAFYRELGVDAIPFRGGVAANTVAGTLSGWSLALEYSKDALGGRLPLSRLLADAIHYARHGIPVTRSQHATTTAEARRPARATGIRRDVSCRRRRAGGRYAVPAAAAGGDVPAACERRASTISIAATSRARLRAISRRRAARSRVDDLASHRAGWRKPLALAHSLGSVYNLPPPTQGVVSLLILGILDALDVGATDPMGADYVHLCVEAAKQAFGVRDRHVTDPAYMTRRCAGSAVDRRRSKRSRRASTAGARRRGVRAAVPRIPSGWASSTAPVAR